MMRIANQIRSLAGGKMIIQKHLIGLFIHGIYHLSDVVGLPVRCYKMKLRDRELLSQIINILLAVQFKNGPGF